MKHTKTLLLSTLISLFCYSCGESTSFETSQPADGQVLKSIPITLQGRYLSNEDKELLVKAYSAADIYRADKGEGYHLDSLNLDIEKDSIEVIERTAESMKLKLDEDFFLDVRIEGDSAYFDFGVPDVIFSMNDGDVLIKKGASYYFNAKQTEGDFKIRRVSFDQDDMLMESLVPYDSIRKLLKISPDSTLKNLDISAEQFRLLDGKGFEEKRRYKRVSE